MDVLPERVVSGSQESRYSNVDIRSRRQRRGEEVKVSGWAAHTLVMRIDEGDIKKDRLSMGDER